MLVGFFKKYSHLAKEDLFEIRDEKREWFNIDTSQYMNYTFDDIHGYHAHHGPQPDDMVMNQTWNIELDKYMRGEESNVKSHPFWNDYKYTYTDEGTWPKVDDIEKVFTAPFTN